MNDGPSTGDARQPDGSAPQPAPRSTPSAPLGFPETPPPIPDFELLRRIGRGSYGEVWLARNVLGDYRAIKIVYRQTFENARPFEREFEGIQRFEPISRTHESQVDILNVGRGEGYFYYVMELADDAGAEGGGRRTEWQPSEGEKGKRGKGEVEPSPEEQSPFSPFSSVPPPQFSHATYTPKTLRSEIQRRGRLPFAECLDIALKLTTALAHIHQHGLVHRDVKPSNIIFVHGIPKLADLGLVARADATLSFVGTEGFLPPEGPGKPPADIYSLGKVLYEMCTGRDRQAFPEVPTEVQADAASDGFVELNEVILKACESNVRGRYASAEAMHADLVLIQAGKSLLRARTIERRLAWLTKLSVAGVTLTALVIAAYFYQQSQTREARRLQRHAEDLAAQMQIREAESLFVRGESSLALAHLAQVLRRHPDRQIARVAAERIMSALTQRNFPRLVMKPLLHQSALERDAAQGAAHFSPDGEHIVTASSDGKVRVWNAQTGQMICESPAHRGAINSVAFSPDGSKLVTASSDGRAFVLNAATGALEFQIVHERPVNAAESSLADAEPAPDNPKRTFPVLDAKFSPDGVWIATAGADGAVRRFNLRTSEELTPLGHNQIPVNAIAFSPDSQWVATATEGGRVRIWSVNSGRQKYEKFRLAGAASLIRFSPDGKWLAAGIQDGSTGTWQVQVWDVETGNMVATLLHQNRIYSLDFSPDSQRLLTATLNRVARVWRGTTGEELFRLHHSSIVRSAAFSPDGRWIVTASVDRTARVWDAVTGAAVSEPMLHEGRVHHAEFSRDNQRVLTVGWDDGTVKLWDLRPQRTWNKDLPHQHWVLLAEFDAASSQAITATSAALNTATGNNGADGWDQEAVIVWDVASGKSRHAATLPEEVEAVTARFTDPGPRALIAERAGAFEFVQTARILDLTNGSPIGEPIQHDEKITCAHLSGDGLKLASASEPGPRSDGVINIWDASKGIALHRLEHPGRILSVRFSPDDKMLVSASSRGTAMIWAVESGRLLAGPLKHDAGIWFAQFSRQGEKVVTASLDRTAKIWSSSGELLATLQHRAPVEYAEFSPDGARVVTASGDGTARVWNVSGGKLLTELQRADLAMTARFSPDGLRIITASMDGTAQVWDAATGLRLGDPFRHGALDSSPSFSNGGDRVTSASFSPDGRWAITASLDRTARIWEVPVASAPIPAWLPELAEAIGGQRLNPDRIAQPVPWTAHADLKARLAKSSATDLYTQWARRFFDDLTPPASIRDRFYGD
jgi:WD40 repeat protein/serine/threonine protein kinase